MNEFSPSELIYLYIDGEADAGQQAVLFSALAHDAELQAEFSDALSMRLSLTTEVQSTVPPPGIKEALMHKAGFAAGATGTTAASSAPAASTASVAVSGWTAALKAAPALLFASALGAAVVATGFVVFGGAEQPPSEVVRPLSAQVAPAQSAADPVGTSVDSDAAVVAAGGDGPKTTLRRQSFPRTVETVSVPEATDGEEYRSAVITAAAPQAGSLNVGLSSAADGGVGAVPDAATAFATVGGEPIRWAIHVRGLAGLRLFPGRSVQPDMQEQVDNIAVAALWCVTDEHAVGIEAGRESLPLYVVDNSSLQYRQSLQWAGILYRYTPESLHLPGGLQPFASGQIGASVSGPLVKSLLGVQWSPDSRIALSLGVEATALMYRYRQQWFSTQKLGVSYGVSVAFP